MRNGASADSETAAAAWLARSDAWSSWPRRKASVARAYSPEAGSGSGAQDATLAQRTISAKRRHHRPACSGQTNPVTFDFDRGCAHRKGRAELEAKQGQPALVV